MAISEPINLNTSTSGVYLEPEQANEIWDGVVKQSAVAQLARRMDIPGQGVVIDTLGDATPASWVGETAEKPVSTPTIGNKKIIPYKLAKIIPVSDEFKRDKSRLWDRIVAQASEGFAQTYDQTFLTGAIPLPISGGNGMDTLADAQQVGIGNGKYADFAKIVTTVLNNGGDLNGIALSPQGQSAFLTATDNNGRPLLVDDPSTAGMTSRFGARIVKSPWGYKTGSPNILGVAGDWTQAIFATVGGIFMKMSNQATITIDGEPVNLWQRNMTAILLEATVGFVVRDKTKFVVITDSTGA